MNTARRLFLLVAALSLPVAAAEVATLAPGSSVFVWGSFVNLRQAPRNDAASLALWPPNTALRLLARSGDWCEVDGPVNQHGFVACRLLGDRPLTLTDLGTANAGDAARRAFWVVPSWGRLVAAGQALRQSLLSAAQAETELSTQRAIRWEAPEFEAAKARLRAGVRLSAEVEIDGGVMAPPADVLARLPPGALPKAAPSLFRKRHEFALAPSIDQAVALRGGTLTLKRVLRGPQFQSTRHEEQWFDGAWDIGEAEVGLEPPAVAYGITATGLLDARAISTALVTAAPPETGCGAHDMQRHDSSWQPRTVRPLPGSARVAAEQVLVGLHTVHEIRAVQVLVRDFRVRLLPAEGPPVNSKVAVHEIDLNADRMPDIVVVVSQVPGSISPFLRSAQVFVNVGGAWSLEVDTTEDDCT